MIQDEASQLVAMLAGPTPGARVLDTCASPGGKTTAIAATLPEGGFIVACDVRDRRMQLLRRTIEATGAARVRLVQADLLAPLPFSILFDTVLVDAPCSGLGILRRDPDIRWRRLAADLPAFAAAQRRMLTLAAKAVAPGGRLVYATCSSEPEENEDIVDWFLDAVAAIPACSCLGGEPGVVRRAHRCTRAICARRRPATSSKRSTARSWSGIAHPDHRTVKRTRTPARVPQAHCRPLVVPFSRMLLRTRVWSAGKFFVIAGALVATYILVCGGFDAPGDPGPRSDRCPT